MCALTMYNNCLWKMCGSKLEFTSSYHPQADPAEQANRQVMEALRDVVATWLNMTNGTWPCLTLHLG